MKDTPQNSTETLARSLKAAGIPFEVDDDGNVKATPEVVEYLGRKEALHDPENPVILTKEEMEAGGRRKDLTDEEKGYVYRELTKEEVEAGLDSGEYERGQSELEAASAYHKGVERYMGPIPELHGEEVFTKRDKNNGLAVQFRNPKLVLNGRALGYGWHDFPYEHFTDTRPFVDRWKDISSELRAHIRKGKKIPRLRQGGGSFQGPKENRRGTKGAFGGKGARRARLAQMRRANEKNYLINILTEGDAEDKTIAVAATSQKLAVKQALRQHEIDFPDDVVEKVEVHKTDKR